ncbi:MAG: L,D-transpeptidase family protein [Chthoniobacterales bacterium]
MAPSLLAIYLLLSSLWPQLTQLALDTRQDQLEEGVLKADQGLVIEAASAGADVNHPISMTSGRLRELGYVNRRLAHYFTGETHASPLIVAAALGENAICETLLSHGAKRYLVSSWGWMPAQYAAKLGHPELAQQLFDSDPRAAHYAILIRLASQTVILYKDGLTLVRGRISTGRPGFDTPAGRYLVTDKERTRLSSLYKVPMPYFLRLSFSEYGIHQGHNPGRPASHGCIRVAGEQVARTIFDRTPIGTLVTIE